MKRRQFLCEGILGGAAALGTGGYLFFRRYHARAEATSRMLDDALPAFAAQAYKELQTLPAQAREEVRRYFHGKCLNVESFVTHVCSPTFGDKLGRCRSQEERDCCFLQAFCARVATDVEILNQVDAIAADVGGEIDAEWVGYCISLSSRWNTRIRGHGTPLMGDELAERLGGLIRGELAQAAREVATGLRRPSVGETIGKIGESAIRLLPYARVGIALGPGRMVIEGNLLVLPAFFLEAARHLWDFIAARLQDRRAEHQAAISGQLARLGNRVGAEFEREVCQRLADLHTWQEQAIRETAGRLAEERIGLL